MATALAATLDDQRRALVVIEIGHLAIQAVMAFHIVDVPIRMDGLNFTFVITQPAGVSTLPTPFEPVEYP